MNENNSTSDGKNTKTFFAPAERSSPEELAVQSGIALGHPVIRCALNVFEDPTMILNENRQVIGCSESLVKALGINDISKLMGKRPGEILNCVNVKDGPSGCGTSKACKTCFAVITILATQYLNNEKSGYCCITTETDGVISNRMFFIKCIPVATNGFTSLIFTIKEMDGDPSKILDQDPILSKSHPPTPRTA